MTEDETLTLSPLGILVGIVGILVIFGGGIFLFSGSSDVSGTTSAESAGTGQPSIGEKAPEATFTTVDGKKAKLSDYRGQKVMFFVFATWCPTCQRGVEVLEENNDKLKDVKFVAVKTHGNAGYSGPSTSQFIQQHGPGLADEGNWVWGDLSQQSTRVWNPRNVPDVYYLIDENGTIRDVDTAPAATLNKIQSFAG